MSVAAGAKAAAESSTDLRQKTEQYARDHNIAALFSHITQLIAYHRPDDPRAFVLAEIKKMQQAAPHAPGQSPTGGEPTHLFTEDDLETMFRMIDVAKQGHVTRGQLRNACCNLSASSMAPLGGAPISDHAPGATDGGVTLPEDVEEAIRAAADPQGRVPLSGFKTVLSLLLRTRNTWNT